MFKANDMVVDITMGIVFLIGAFYGFLMFFDPSFTMTRYSTGAEYDEGTITIFTIWLGMFNLGFIAGIMYMGYRGLDRVERRQQGMRNTALKSRVRVLVKGLPITAYETFEEWILSIK